MREVAKVRALLGPADPTRSVRVAPTTTPAALIHRAETAPVELPDSDPVPVRRRLAPRLAVAATFVLVLAIVGAAVLYLGRGNPPDRTAVPPDLHAFADRISDAPYDSRTDRYAYIRTAGIYEDTRPQAGDGNTIPEAAPPVYWTFEADAWRADDGSGESQTTRLEYSFPDEESRRYYAEDGRTRGLDAPRTETWVFEPGQWVSRVVGRLPRDPEKLARDLPERVDLTFGSATLLQLVDMLNRERIPSRDARAAILRALADTKGVEYRGRTVDPEGRPGIAVSGVFTTDTAASLGVDPEPYLLIFDPVTGELLASGTPRAGGTTIDTAKPYTVYLERAYNDTISHP